MKNLRLLLAAAVVVLGLGLGAYAGDDGLSPLATGALNINTATVEELSMLPYMDRVTAQNIVDFRDSHGPFTSIDELKDIKGINRTFLDQLRGNLKVDGASDLNPVGAVY